MVGGEHSLDTFVPYLLTVWDQLCFEDLEERDDLLGVCRTSQDTLVLINTACEKKTKKTTFTVYPELKIFVG